MLYRRILEKGFGSVMFKPGDLVGLMVQNDWQEFQLTEQRGIVISCNQEWGKAVVVWCDAKQGTEFFEDLKLIAYGKRND